MRTSTKILSFVIALLLLGLVLVATVALHRIDSLSIPIARSTPIATLILPILTGLSLRGAHALARRSHGAFLTKQGSFTWSTVFVFVLLTIYDTVIVTLAITHTGLDANLNCQLDEQWQRLYSRKDEAAIKRIQDRHDCCGLHSVRDRAWPFPVKGRGAEACEEAFGRPKACFGRWKQDEQISAGLLIFVAVLTFLIKVVVILLFRARPSWSRHERYTAAHLATSNAYRDEPDGDGGEATQRPRAITAGGGEVNDEGGNNSAIVQPSRLQENEHRNEWA